MRPYNVGEYRRAGAVLVEIGEGLGSVGLGDMGVGLTVMGWDGGGVGVHDLVLRPNFCLNKPFFNPVSSPFSLTRSPSISRPSLLLPAGTEK